MPDIVEPDLECEGSQLEFLTSDYYWGLNPEQNPNNILTEAQIECSKSLLEAELQAVLEAFNQSLTAQSHFYWQWNSGVQNKKFAILKSNANNCAPGGEGEPPPFFSGSGWALAIKYCWQEAEA